MNQTDNVQFLSNTIRGLKSALLDSSNEISQLKNSCLSLYMKFTKEQVKSMELGIAFNKMKTKFGKVMKDSQSEICELKKELLSKENEIVNLNFKVKELQAHVEEKTRLIESHCITVSELKAEKQNIPEIDGRDIIEVIKTSLKKADKYQGLQILKELKKFLKKFKKKESPINVKNASDVKSEETDLDLCEDEVPDIHFHDSVVFNVLNEMSELKRLACEIESFKTFCYKEDMFPANDTGFPITSESSRSMMLTDSDDSPEDILSTFSGCSENAVSVKVSGSASIVYGLPVLISLNTMESSAGLSKRKNSDTCVNMVDTKKQKLDFDNSADLESEKLNIEMNGLLTNDTEITEITLETAVSNKISKSLNIIGNMPTLENAGSWNSLESKCNTSANPVNTKFQKLNFDDVDSELEKSELLISNDETSESKFFNKENTFRANNDHFPMTSKPTKALSFTEIKDRPADCVFTSSICAEKEVAVNTSKSNNSIFDIPELENAGSLNVLECPQTLIQRKSMITSINSVDAKKQKLEFNIDVDSETEKSESEDKSLNSDINPVESKFNNKENIPANGNHFPVTSKPANVLPFSENKDRSTDCVFTSSTCLEKVVNPSKSNKSISDLTEFENAGSLNISENPEDLIQRKCTVTPINSIDAKKEKLEFNIDALGSVDDSLNSNINPVESKFSNKENISVDGDHFPLTSKSSNVLAFNEKYPDVLIQQKNTVTSLYSVDAKKDKLEFNIDADSEYEKSGNDDELLNCNINLAESKFSNKENIPENGEHFPMTSKSSNVLTFTEIQERPTDIVFTSSVCTEKEVAVNTSKSFKSIFEIPDLKNPSNVLALTEIKDRPADCVFASAVCTEKETAANPSKSVNSIFDVPDLDNTSSLNMSEPKEILIHRKNSIMSINLGTKKEKLEFNINADSVSQKSNSEEDVSYTSNTQTVGSEFRNVEDIFRKCNGDSPINSASSEGFALIEIKDGPTDTVSTFSVCTENAGSVKILSPPTICDMPSSPNGCSLHKFLGKNIILLTESNDFSTTSKSSNMVLNDIKSNSADILPMNSVHSENKAPIKISESTNVTSDTQAFENDIEKLCCDIGTNSNSDSEESNTEIEELLNSDVSAFSKYSSGLFDETKDAESIKISELQNNVCDMALQQTGCLNKLCDKENIFSADKDDFSLASTFSNFAAFSVIENNLGETVPVTSLIKILESDNNSVDTKDETSDFYNGANFESKRSEKGFLTDEMSIESKLFNKENIFPAYSGDVHVLMTSDSSNDSALNEIGDSIANTVPTSVCSKNAMSVKISKPLNYIGDTTGFRRPSFMNISAALVSLVDGKNNFKSLNSVNNQKEKMNSDNCADFEPMKLNIKELLTNDTKFSEYKIFDKGSILPVDRDLFPTDVLMSNVINDSPAAAPAVYSENTVSIKMCDMLASKRLNILESPAALSNQKNNLSLKSVDTQTKKLYSDIGYESKFKKRNTKTKSLSNDISEIASSLVEITNEEFHVEKVEVENNNVFSIIQEMVSLHEKTLDGKNKFTELYLELDPPLSLLDINNQQSHNKLSENDSGNCEQNAKKPFVFNNLSQKLLINDSLKNTDLKSRNVELADLHDFSDRKEVNCTEHTLINTDEAESDEEDNLIIAEDAVDEESIKTNKDDVIYNKNVMHDGTGCSSFSKDDTVNENRVLLGQHVLSTDLVRQSWSSPAVDDSPTSNEPRISAPRYNLRNHKSIASESLETFKEPKSEKVQAKTGIPKFYVENKIQDNCRQVTYLTSLDEIWSKIKDTRLGSSTMPEGEATNLVSYTKSVVHAAFYRKIGRKPVKNAEKIIKLALAKRILKTFVEDRSKDCSTAFSKCLESLHKSNKNTISCALAELLKDIATENAETQDKMIPELLTLAFEVERNVFSGFLEVLKTALESKIHFTTWNATDTTNGSAANGSIVSNTIVWSRFFTALCKMLNDADGVVSFVHRSLMLLKFRAHPIAYSVMVEWPHVFSVTSYKNTLLVQIILFTLVNHKMKYNSDLYKALDVQKSVGHFYKIRLGTKTAEEYAKESMLKLNDKSWVDAVVLLCKRQMFCWAYTNVIMKYMLPIINKWKTENFNEAILIKVLDALQEIMASCPTGEHSKMYNIDSIVRELSNILILNKGTRELKEAVAVVLCELGTVRFSVCADALFSWTPPDGLLNSKTLDKMHMCMIKHKNFSQWSYYVAPEKFSKETKDKIISPKGWNNVPQKRKMNSGQVGKTQAAKRKKKKKKKKNKKN